MENMNADGSQLVQLLSRVPRIILLILKTNDLSMSLEHSSNVLQVAC